MTSTATQMMTATDLYVMSSVELLDLVLDTSETRIVVNDVSLRLAAAADRVLADRIADDAARADALAADAHVKLITVRSWALANGLNVSARGRVPARIVERYIAATTVGG